MTTDYEVAVIMRASQFPVLAEMLWEAYYATRHRADFEQRFRALIMQVSTHTEAITPEWLEKRLAALSEQRVQPEPKTAPAMQTPTGEAPKPGTGGATGSISTEASS